MHKIIHRLTTAQTDNIFIQLFRYTFVGGIAFVADFGSLWLLTEYAGFHYQISALIGFILGLTINYILSVRWVFAGSAGSTSNKSVEFIIFALIGIVGLGLNSLIMWIFTDVIEFHYLGSKLISTVLVFLWNFLGRRVLMTTPLTSLSVNHPS